MLIAIAHLIGAFIASTLFGLLIIYIGSWEQGRNQRIANEEASVALGLKVSELENEVYASRILEYSSKKFSSDLLINRISDFCGTIRFLWGWLGNITQAILFIAICWYSITDNTGHAIYFWGVVVVSIFFWAISVIFSLPCKLVTGRYPGQAKEARKAAAKWVEERGEIFQTKIA